MTEEKRYYVLGSVYHQDDTGSPIELLGDRATEPEVSNLISDIMNRSFAPKNIFVIEGVKKEIKIKDIRIE